jgi:hypothetical protein
MGFSHLGNDIQTCQYSHDTRFRFHRNCVSGPTATSVISLCDARIVRGGGTTVTGFRDGSFNSDYRRHRASESVRCSRPSAPCAADSRRLYTTQSHTLVSSTSVVLLTRFGAFAIAAEITPFAICKIASANSPVTDRCWTEWSRTTDLP